MLGIVVNSNVNEGIITNAVVIFILSLSVEQSIECPISPAINVVRVNAFDDGKRTVRVIVYQLINPHKFSFNLRTCSSENHKHKYQYKITHH